METTAPSTVHHVSRWSLWLVACVCFGPLTLALLFGVLMLPLWIGMLAMALSEPGRFADAAGAPISAVVWPICHVVGGVVFTIRMVAAGFAALATFDWTVFGGSENLADVGSVAGLAVCVVLPFNGAAWLLAMSWRSLIGRRAIERDDNVAGGGQ